MSGETLAAIGDIFAGAGVLGAVVGVIVAVVGIRASARDNRQAAEQNREAIEQGRLSVAEARAGRREERLDREVDRLARLFELAKRMWSIIDRLSKGRVERAVADAEMDDLLYEFRAALALVDQDELPRCRYLDGQGGGQVVSNGGWIGDAESEVEKAITRRRQALRDLA